MSFKILNKIFGMSRKQLRVLCLHGFRTSGRIMKMQMRDVIRFCPNVDFVFVGTL